MNDRLQACLNYEMYIKRIELLKKINKEISMDKRDQSHKLVDN